MACRDEQFLVYRLQEDESLLYGHRYSPQWYPHQSHEKQSFFSFLVGEFLGEEYRKKERENPMKKYQQERLRRAK